MTALLCLALLAQSPQEPAGAVPAPFLEAQFREHVTYLASDELAGRAVGSDGSAKAMDYIIRHLRECGATGLGGSWYQSFPFATNVLVNPRSSLAVVDGPEFKLGRDFNIDLLSPSGEWEAELVFVGYGLAVPKLGYNDFAGIDLRGKIAVALGDLPKPLVDASSPDTLNRRWEECQRRGALALITIAPKGVEGFGTSGKLRGEPLLQRMPRVLMTRAAAVQLFPKNAGQADPLGALERDLLTGGPPRPQSRALDRKVRLRARLERTPVMGRNVLAILPGKGELANQAVVVSTHHDHLGTMAVKDGEDDIYHGADDNASGCAALLLVARALHADRTKLPASYRTVILASFDAEEQGLIGSRHYVTNPLWPLQRTTANLNFDMVGRLSQAGKLLAVDSQSSAFLAERVAALAAPCGLRVETRLNGPRRSDHINFMDREIPAIHFCTGMHADYHQVTDETARIDNRGGARVAWLAYRLLRETMEASAPLRYRRPDPTFNLSSLVRLVIKLGIIPEQNAQSGRYALIRFVTPGSLAAKHGLQAGDEITGFNGATFQRIEDGAILLAQFRFDQDLRLHVLRKGNKVDVVVPAEAFADLRGPLVRPLGDERYEVLFRYKPGGRPSAVSLAGSFNDWKAKAQPMEGPDKEGFYSARLKLRQGFYEYKFVIDGKTWEADPTNVHTTGQFGNSLLTVGGQP